MYLANAGGCPRAVSTVRAAEGRHTAMVVATGSSEVCVATVHFAGRGAFSVVRKLPASGAGNSTVISLVDGNFTSNYNKTTHGEEISHLLNIPQ